MYKYFLVRPSFRIFVRGNDSTIKELNQALQTPLRPLYIGQSDDLVVVSNIQLLEVRATYSKIIHSVVEGVHPGCEVVKLPRRFRDLDTIEYISPLSVPHATPLTLAKEIPVWEYSGNNIWMKK
jgi:CRISPR-associated protein Cas5h